MSTPYKHEDTTHRDTSTHMLFLGTQRPPFNPIHPFLYFGPDTFAGARRFNPRNHSFAIGRDAYSVRDFADILYSSGEGQNTLTVRNGKRALSKLLKDNPIPLHKLTGDTKDPAIAEALATVDDLLFSPVLKKTLTRKPNFTFEGSITADLSDLHPKDAVVLARLMMSQFKGHIYVPNARPILCPLHLSLIDKGRLSVGLNTLSEVPLPLRQALLTIPQKYGAGCTYDDALVLAQYAGLIPGTVEHTTFVGDHISPSPEVG